MTLNDLLILLTIAVCLPASAFVGTMAGHLSADYVDKYPRRPYRKIVAGAGTLAALVVTGLALPLIVGAVLGVTW